GEKETGTGRLPRTAPPSGLIRIMSRPTITSVSTSGEKETGTRRSQSIARPCALIPTASKHTIIWELRFKLKGRKPKQKANLQKLFGPPLTPPPIKKSIGFVKQHLRELE